MPPLDLFRGFEAAARHLSFTRAAEELFVTQSAVSRQIQTIEEKLGVRLFERRNRGLALTAAGEQLYRATAGALRTLHDAVERLAPETMQKMVSVSATMGFCSLWLIPRLAAFRTQHPQVDVRISANNAILDIDREHIDLAIRYCAASAAPPGAVRLFGEEIVPVCNPTAMKGGARPLKTPRDLEHHVLLHYEDPDGHVPWLTWDIWLETAGVAGLRPAGALRFNHYDQVVRAAIDGQGIALGRRPLIRNQLADGTLLAPFPHSSHTDRAYFLVRTPATAARVDVDQFADWVIRESAGGATASGEKMPKHPAARPAPPR